MKFITDFKEFHSSCEKSALDSISDKPVENKELILKYLKNGTDAGVRCSTVFDIVQNEHAPITIHLYTDGEYKWTDTEIYHFEHYNVELNEEFMKKVLKAS